MGRVCAIGLDAGSIDFIDELCAAGELPTLADLRTRSARTRLHSAPAHRDGMLWTQFVTGREASFDRAGFRCTFDPATYAAWEDSAHYDDHGIRPFWETSGVPTITFDVPRSTISGPGVHVTAWGAHAPSYPRASVPRGLLREIDERFGVHPGFENEYACGWHDPKRLDRLVGALETGAERAGEISAFLMQRFPDWQLFVMVMSESHSASEMMWHGLDPYHPLADYDPEARARLTRVFQAMDRALATMLRVLRPDDTIFVFSLDGIRSSHGDLPSIVLLPELMHRDQIGTPLLHDPDQAAWRRAGCPPLIPRRGSLWRHELDRSLVHQPPRSQVQRLQRTRAYEAARGTPPGRWVVERLKHTPIGAFGIPILPESDERPEAMEAKRDRADEMLFLGNYQPYWHRMRSFVLPTFGDAYLRINLRGRERDGRVAVEEYDDERRRLDALVHACRDARTGEPVAEDVQWLDTLAASDRDDRQYADGVVHWRHPTDAFEHPDLGMVGPFPLHRTGTHHETGFVWAAGPGVMPGDRDDRPVVDLAPTILHALDPDAALPPSGAPIAMTQSTRLP